MSKVAFSSRSGGTDARPTFVSGMYKVELYVRVRRADGEPVVVSEDSGRSGRVTCRGRRVPKWADGLTSLPKPSRNRPQEHQISLRSHQNMATAYSVSLSPTSKTLSSAAC